MTRAEVIDSLRTDPPGESYILVRKSTRHRRVDDERRRYLRVEVQETQRETWGELWEALVEQCNGNKSMAFDRVLSGMGEEVAQGNAQ